MMNELRFAGNGPIIAFGRKDDATTAPSPCQGGASARKAQCPPMAPYENQPGQKFDRFA